jgi:hypothetical protein
MVALPTVPILTHPNVAVCGRMGGMVIPPESPAHGREIHRRNGYSAENYLLMNDESTVGMVFLRESRAHGRLIRLAGSKCAKNLLNKNNSMISNSKCSLPGMSSVLKIYI